MKQICVYCGSSDRIPEAYLKAAYEMGKIIANRGMNLVYGAGSTGMMGAVANGVLEAGGEVWGVMPKNFDTPQLAHTGCTHYEVVEDMHVRKARMAELSDGFIALPGGLGTFEELFEIVTWAQIGLHRKPVGILNTNGYYDHILAMVAHADAEGFIYSEHRDFFNVAAQPAALLDLLLQFQYPDGLEKWVDREGRG